MSFIGAGIEAYMNKWFLGAALCCAAAAASAQGSGNSGNVQLYGFLYSGVRHVDNTGGGSLNGLATGPSRWGLRGTEDLGDGLAASFVLESGFDLGSGNFRQGGRAFGRQAYVGLGGKGWGQVTLGRQYDLVAAWIAPYTPAGKWNGYMAHVGDNDNLNWQFRINNAVKYVTPVVGGFQAGALYGFGEVAGNNQQNRTTSVGATYKSGALSLAAGYLQVNNPASAVAEGNWNSILFPSVSASSPLSPKAVTPERMTVAGLGGDVTAGPFKVAASYTRSAFKQIGTAITGVPNTDVKFQNFDANLSYSITSSWQAGAGYTHTAGEVDATGFKPKYHQLNLMSNYFLSRRTILQVAAIHQRAAGDAQHAYILFGSNAVSSTNHQLMLLAGVFHVF